jgi:hypothetical protein
VGVEVVSTSVDEVEADIEVVGTGTSDNHVVGPATTRHRGAPLHGSGCPRFASARVAKVAMRKRGVSWVKSMVTVVIGDRLLSEDEEMIVELSDEDLCLGAVEISGVAC